MTFVQQVIEQYEKMVPVYEDSMPITGRALSSAISWLKEAKVLRLNTPLLVSDSKERMIAEVSEYGLGLDTPWTVTAIEYEHGGTYDIEDDKTRALCTKRIALCVQLSFDVAPGLKPMNEEDAKWGVLMVWPISYFDEKKEWEFSLGAAIIPRYQAKHEIINAENLYLVRAIELEQKIRGIFGSKAHSKKASDPLSVSYQQLFIELCKKVGEEHAQKMITESSLDALWVALSTFTAMNCSNVVIDKEERTLHCYTEDGERVDLDAFKGKRLIGGSFFKPSSIWSQESRGFHDFKKSEKKL